MEERGGRDGTGLPRLTRSGHCATLLFPLSHGSRGEGPAALLGGHSDCPLEGPHAEELRPPASADDPSWTQISSPASPSQVLG